MSLLLIIFFLVFLLIFLQFFFQILLNKFWKSSSTNESHKKAEDYHIGRRLQHIITGLLFYYLMETFDVQSCQLISFIGLTTTIALQIARLYSPWLNKTYLETFKGILRPHECNSFFPGATHFQFGCFLSVFFFQPYIARLSFIILTFADPFASLSGIYFKKIFQQHQNNSNKTWIGTLGGAVAAAIACLIIEQDLFITGILFLTSIVAERIPTKREWGIDDNWTIPLASSVILTILFQFIPLK